MQAPVAGQSWPAWQPCTGSQASAHVNWAAHFMCDDSLWQYLAPELARTASVQFANLLQGDSIAAMAERIGTEMPDQSIVLGFSMGGYVARQIALMAPHKVAGLILLNTSARATSAAELQHNRKLIEVSKNVHFKGQPLRAFQRALHPDGMNQQKQAELLAQLQAMSTRLGHDVFRRQLGIIREDGHLGLAQIGCPTLVIGSRNDQMRTVEESENLAKGIRHAKLAIIEDCGHMSPLEQPKRVLELIHQWRAAGDH